MESKKADVIEKVDRIIRPGITRDEMINTYKEWAQDYDKDMSLFRRSTPQETVASLVRLEPDKKCRILDLAAGTGEVGQLLSENGFTNIDAYDASAEMLEVARSKKVYKDFYCQFIGPSKSPGIDDGTYDAIISVGAFYSGHLDQTCLPEVFRMLRKGGRLILSQTSAGFVGELDREISKMEDAGIFKAEEKRHIEMLTEYGDGNIIVLQKC